MYAELCIGGHELTLLLFLAVMLNNRHRRASSTPSTQDEAPTDVCSLLAAIVCGNDVDLAVVGTFDTVSRIFTNPHQFHAAWFAGHASIVKLWVRKGKVIYHQTMTPTWLEAHASYIDSTRTASSQQLTFNAGSQANAALLKVPMIAACILNVAPPLNVEITVAHNVSIGGKPIDSDIIYGVSDGTKFIGFETCDKYNYASNAPCYGTEGLSGIAFSSVRYEPLLPKPRDSFYPGQFVFTLKLDERWGSCYTAHDGGFVRTAGYNNRLMLNKGLTLEVYKSDKGEMVGIRFIKVAIIQDEA